MSLLRKKPTKETLFLKPAEFERVMEVLHDLKKVVICDVVIGGSLVQRALVPEFGAAVAGRPVYDIDTALTAGDLEHCQILPTVRDYFYVMDIVESKDSYYFGMIHKKTLIWTDVFAEPYSKEYGTIMLGSEKWRLASIESQLLWMGRDIISRISKGEGIHKKHIPKIELFLKLPNLNLPNLEKEFSDNRAYFMKKVPAEQKGSLSDVASYLKYAVEQGKAYPLGYRPWFKTDYHPEDTLVTENGISIESEETFRKLRYWRFREWLRKKMPFLF